MPHGKPTPKLSTSWQADYPIFGPFRLIYWLKWLLRWKDIFIIGWLLLQAFTLGYNLQYDWDIKWKGVEVGGKITMTPKLPAGEE